MGIQRQDHHLCVGDCLEGFNNRELLYRFADVFAFAHTGGIDQRVALGPALVVNVDAIAGRARLVEDHHPLFPEQAIHQRRLTHVRAPDDRYTNTSAGCVRRLGRRVVDPR